MNSSVEPVPACRGAWQRAVAHVLALLGLLVWGPSMPDAAWAQAPAPVLRLRVVGGLTGVNQFKRHEEPFWTQQLSQLSGGRYSAEIVAFDRAGIRGPEMLSLLQLGTVPFGTLLLAQGSPKDMELSAVDLAGLNPDMASLRRSVAAYRPRLETLLRERHGIELLAVFSYPAQVLFCNKPISGLASIKGLRVRTSSTTQNDWAEALGALPVSTPFADIGSNFRAGNIDCAITGTMSGNTIGLQTLSTHLHTQPINWGLSIFAANGAAWQALPEDLKALLRRELPRLEQAVWAESERETQEGIACNTGSEGCVRGQRGQMTAVPTSTADARRQREILAATVLPRWLQRCGPQCAEAWNRTLGPLTGIEAHAR